MKFKKTILSNGLRVITVPTPGNPAVTVLVLVEAGSNYENKDTNGLSHFLEHMCFKGTLKRLTAGDIARELDGLGAENNAFTSNEMTGYYAKADKKHYKKLLDIISDIYLNPTFPEADLEKERGVIIQEISMYEDLPQKIVWHVLAELMYGDSPAGRPIIGSKENILKFNRADFVQYRNAHYTARKTVVVVAGDVNERGVVKEVKQHFKETVHAKKLGKLKVIEKQKDPYLKIHKKKTDQTHMVLAFRGLSAKDVRLPAAELLAAILGQGMSSRLFHRLREEMGACYAVKALHEAYTDHGLFAIYTAVDAKRVKEVVGVILEEVRKLRDETLSGEELNKAKEYYLGHLYMHLESTDALAEFYGEQEVVTGRNRTPQEIEKKMRAVSTRDIMKLARELFQNKKLNLAVVGDIESEQSLKRALKL